MIVKKKGCVAIAIVVILLIVCISFSISTSSNVELVEVVFLNTQGEETEYSLANEIDDLFKMREEALLEGKALLVDKINEDLALKGVEKVPLSELNAKCQNESEGFDKMLIYITANLEPSFLKTGVTTEKSGKNVENSYTWSIAQTQRFVYEYSSAKGEWLLSNSTNRAVAKTVKATPELKSEGEEAVTDISVEAFYNESDNVNTIEIADPNGNFAKSIRLEKLINLDEVI